MGRIGIGWEMGISLRVLGGGGVAVVVVEEEEALASIVEEVWKSLKIGGMPSSYGVIIDREGRASVFSSSTLIP